MPPYELLELKGVFRSNAEKGATIFALELQDVGGKKYFTQAACMDIYADGIEKAFKRLRSVPLEKSLPAPTKAPNEPEEEAGKEVNADGSKNEMEAAEVQAGG
jgi:hypothetical protein